jgi:hypothetical protein
MLRVLAGVLIGMIWAGFGQAYAEPWSGPKTPVSDANDHLGVASCGSSTCHSRQEASGVIVQQNEVSMWQDKSSVSGAHYRAYQTLRTQRSKDIARILKIGQPWQAKECLSCHGDAVRVSARGQRFHAGDGVGCESCHGGAQNWLNSHFAEGADHRDNLQKGLVALENPKRRAQVCLSCHLGSTVSGQFVTHRIMAAGHPRISFELDLFTALQSHHDEDADYSKRKGRASGGEVWAMGQAQSLQTSLHLFMDERVNRDGWFPEPVFFDCMSCHRPIYDDPDWRSQWRENPARAIGPGQVRFNDSALIMLEAAAPVLAPDLAADLERAGRRFHRSLSENPDDMEAAAQSLILVCEKLEKHFASARYSGAINRAMLDNVVDVALARRYTDYVAAEQAVMAMDTLLSAMIAQRQISASRVNGIRQDIELAYKAVEKPTEYDQKAMILALERIANALEAL